MLNISTVAVLALAALAQTADVPAVAPPVHIAVNATTLAALPRLTICATDEAGRTSAYRGVALRDVLAKYGVPSGKAVRGKVMLRYVVVGAADGYHVVFALPELGASYTDRVVLVGEAKDGDAFPPAAGPYRIIVR